MLWATIHAATRLHVEGTARVCHDALLRLYDTRYWFLPDMAVDNIATWMASTDQIDTAAMVFGRLDRHHAPFDRGGQVHRSRGLSEAQRHRAARTLMAQGAAMDRDDLIKFVLERLASVAGSPPVPLTIEAFEGICPDEEALREQAEPLRDA